MPDKNDMKYNVSYIKTHLGCNNIDVNYTDPFTKIKFLDLMIRSVEQQVIYVDFDLLYSGYVTSNIIELKKNVMLLQPTRHNIINIIKLISSKISKNRYITIIDSLNGFYNLFDNTDAGLHITTNIMLIISLSKITRSTVLFTNIVDSSTYDDCIILDITGTRIIKPKTTVNIKL